MSGLLNLSSIEGEAISFASTHTSTHPRVYVLVTGSGSNGEFNCLGKKINKQHYAASLTSSHKGGLLFFFNLRYPELVVLTNSQGFPLHFTVKKKLLSDSAPSRSPVIFKAAPFQADLLEESCSSRKNRDVHRRPHKVQSRRRTHLKGSFPFMISASFSVRWAPCHVSKISVRTVFNRTSTHIFMSR